ncbi:Death on curing protein, Doc toxin [hydrothermal vent metagenome]|uniref:Death on curing protein, Doc toxin n=1 Tax=hydrothermal vent metagenome TaxID=652676 RepID=A0A3B1BBD8_9ZZZZ
MAKIIWTEPALSDLKGVAEYIALDKLDAAKRFVNNTFLIVDRLEKFPDSGRKPPELKRSRYKEVIVNPCRIFYRFDKKNDKVYIIFVMRSEMKLRKYMIDERGKEYS